MKWQLTEPHEGDMIRVKLGAIYHYGVYVSDGEVIEFGPPPIRVCAPEDIKVMAAPIDDFLAGGFLEVAEFDKKEKKKNRKPADVVRYARSKLGQGGYDILKNNCEHFAYECVSGVAVSTQTKGLVSSATADVYLAPLPERAPKGRLYPREREEYVFAATSDTVRRERFYAWRLLEYALKASFGYKIKRLDIKRTESGAWSVGGCFVSISHGNGALAVAVSHSPVGIDVEGIGVRSVEHLASRVLTEEENALLKSTEESEREELMLSLWVKKEAEYKRRGDGEVFSPSKISVLKKDIHTEKLTAGEGEYIYAVATAPGTVINTYILGEKDII